MCSQWSLNVLPEMIQRKGQLTSVWLKAASPEAGEHATDDAPEGTQAVVRRSDSDTPFLQISQIVPLRHFFVQKKFVCLVIFCRDLSFLCSLPHPLPVEVRAGGWRYGQVWWASPRSHAESWVRARALSSKMSTLAFGPERSWRYLPSLAECGPRCVPEDTVEHV